MSPFKVAFWIWVLFCGFGITLQIHDPTPKVNLTGQILSGIIWGTIIFGAANVYLSPFWIAAFRRHRQVWGVFVANLLFGMTGFGLVVVGMWALTGKTEDD